MLKKTISLLILLSAALTAFAEGRAKYVFYFIGDGMGVNQVNGTQTYLAALDGRIGVKPLCFSQFPYVALTTTYSGTNGVTDSAASGTALATGKKTKNQAVGVLADLKTPVNSVAVWAQNSGAAVGISTSVSIDHATPASFYAHQPHRKMYYEIGQDLVRSNFDFFAGSDFLIPNSKKDATAPSLYKQCEQAGYTFARGYKDFQRKAKKAEKLILLPTEQTLAENPKALPYAIDRKTSDMTLQDITRAGIKYLTQKNKDGFFFMIEGGKIDWACHANDIATAFKEVVDMDQAVQIAYEFYQQHPDETLIVITADHETGGLSLGCGPYELHTDLLRFQRMSTENYSKHVRKLQEKLGQKFTWEVIENDLKENWGFGDQVKLTEEQQNRLHEAFNDMTSGNVKDTKTLYAKVDALAEAARIIMAECALIGWQSHGHSNGYIPTFAIGAGAEQFQGQIDNTQIPVAIAKAAQWKQD